MAEALDGTLRTDLTAMSDENTCLTKSSCHFLCLLPLLLLGFVPALLGAIGTGREADVGFNDKASKAPKFRVLAEKTPIAYANPETGEGGEATDLIAQIFTKAKLSHSFEYAPWKRAYRLISTQKNIVLYPMGRTFEREDKFHWLGRITPVHYYLFSHQNRISKNPAAWAGLLRADVELSELRHLSVGVVNGNLFHSYLLKHNFSQLAVVNSGRQNIDKVYRGRIDLFAASSAGLHNLCKVKKMDCSQFKVVFRLDELSSGLYFAASKASGPGLIEALKESYLSILESGELKVIMGTRSSVEGEDLRLRHFAPLDIKQ